MTTDDDGFLAAILANPSDPVPRLAYADYLDERGAGDDAKNAARLRGPLAEAAAQWWDHLWRYDPGVSLWTCFFIEEDWAEKQSRRQKYGPFVYEPHAYPLLLRLAGSTFGIQRGTT